MSNANGGFVSVLLTHLLLLLLLLLLLCPYPVLRHCWLGYMAHKIVSKMT